MPLTQSELHVRRPERTPALVNNSSLNRRGNDALTG